MAGANMKCEKNSLALLSCKRTKAFSKTRADEAFALPSFSDAATTDIPSFRLSGHGAKFEHPNDVERLKRTMLQHESMFKEQLYELHRLYQVQRRLMEESKRKNSAGHLHSGSPSSNSSLIYNPDVCKLKGETHCWDGYDAMQVNVRQQPFILPSQLNVGSAANKGHLFRGHSGDMVHGSCHRSTIDLQRPADDCMEIEMEEKPEKPVTMSMLFHGQSTPSQKSWPALNTCSLNAKEPLGMRLLTGSNSEKGRGILGSFWKRVEDCGQDSAMPQMSGHMEVPLFPLGPARTHDSSSKKVLSGLTKPPATNLFGVNLFEQYSCQQKPLPGLYRTHEERNEGSKLVGIEGNQWYKGGQSKLPHWLLQGSSTSTAARMSPIALDGLTTTSKKHHTIHFLLDKFDERKLDLVFEERSSVPDFSGLWPTTCGTRSQCADSFLKVPLTKPSQGSLPCAVTTGTAVQGYHKASLQALGVNESISSLVQSRDETGAAVAPLNSTSCSFFSGIDRQSPLLETHAAGALLLPGPSSRGTSNEAPACLWLHQTPSPSVSESPRQGSQCPFINPCRNVSVVKNHGMMKADNAIERKGPLTELSLKREIFGFMPTARDLHQTLGLDLNVEDTLEPTTRLERLSSFKEVGVAKDKADVGLKFVRNNFDLNVESTDKGLDACCTSDILVRSKEEPEHSLGPVLLASTGILTMVSDKWQTSQNSSMVTGTPCVSSASTPSPIRVFPFTGCREGSYAGVGKLPTEACIMVGTQQQTGSGFFSTLLSSFTNIQGDAREKPDFDNSNQNNVAVDVTEADAAEILLHMGFDMEHQTANDDGGRSLKWLAGLVDALAESHYVGNVPTDSMPARPRVMDTKLESAECLQEIGTHQGKMLDSFELSVLSLKPINPDTETPSMQPVERCDLIEGCPTPLNMRRRSLRRGRLGKDFQKQMLPSIASLSRQEITDDLQIIEGLVRSSTEVMAKSSKEDVIVPRGLLLSKGTGNKGKGSKAFKAGKLNSLLRVCSWGESTRRKRLRRQRSQRLCLPPGV